MLTPKERVEQLVNVYWGVEDSNRVKAAFLAEMLLAINSALESQERVVYLKTLEDLNRKLVQNAEFDHWADPIRKNIEFLTKKADSLNK